MMQVFLPRSLLLLIGIPLWPHQLILWYLPVSLPETFFIPFDFYSHKWPFLSQYPYNSPLTILRFWVTCGVKMMSLCHDWAWQSPQPLLPPSILDIFKVFENIDVLIFGHTAAALTSHTHTSWVGFWGSGSLVESKWCHYIMVEADSQLKLLPVSTLYMYKVFENIDMLSSNSYTHTDWLICWGSGSLVESKWCHYVMV